MHDHFKGYDHLLALTYRDQADRERWLPFVKPWQDIGKLIWKDGGMRVETPGIDIEALSRSK